VYRPAYLIEFACFAAGLWLAWKDLVRTPRYSIPRSISIVVAVAASATGLLGALLLLFFD
jgi:hypothetical protein